MGTDQNPPIPTVAVVGLGKIGLTLAAVYAKNGFKVYGADKKEDVVKLINQGKSHVKNEPGLEQLILDAHQNATLTATTDTSEAVGQSAITIVIVPVLVDESNNVDYRQIDNAVEDIAKGVKKGSLIIFETTLPPGDTRNRFGKKIEEISGLRMGDDFHLAYSPERVYSNRIIDDLRRYPKVIGGLNGKSLELAKDFYQKALGCELIEVSTLETAEFSKIAECVYRDVNIALANELAQFAEEKDVNIMEVITAGNSQPYSHIHLPGIGVGGHCIPIYPYFFMNKGLPEGLTTKSRAINDSMAEFAISKIEKELGSLENRNVLILGLSYRENVKEPTKSSSLLLMDLLKEKKANVYMNDPLFSDSEIQNYGVNPLSMEDSLVTEIDIIILQAFHQAYENLNFSQFKNCKLVLDGRNKLNRKELTDLGIRYEGIGIKGEKNDG